MNGVPSWGEIGERLLMLAWQELRAARRIYRHVKFGIRERRRRKIVAQVEAIAAEVDARKRPSILRDPYGEYGEMQPGQIIEIRRGDPLPRYVPPSQLVGGHIAGPTTSSVWREVTRQSNAETPEEEAYLKAFKRPAGK